MDFGGKTSKIDYFYKANAVLLVLPPNPKALEKINLAK